MLLGTLSALTLFVWTLNANAQEYYSQDYYAAGNYDAGTYDAGYYDAGNYDSGYYDSGYAHSGHAKCAGRQWTLAADAIFLDRSEPTAGILAFNTVNPTQRLRADQFDLGTQAGIEFSLASQLDTDGGVELRYFGVDNWSTSVNTLTTPNNLLRLNAAVPVFAVAGNAIAANYASQLHNAEINFSLPATDCCTVSAGFRYLELDENMSAKLLNAAIPVQYANSTRNRLYGSQFAADLCLWNGDLHTFSLIGKAGVYGNHAAHRGTISTAAATLSANGEANRTAFVGELKTKSLFRLTNHCAVLSGYRLLWLDGVALASDQLGASNFFSGRGFDGTGDVFYHGAYVGLECTF